MQRSRREAAPDKLDVAPLIRTVQYLDAVLKRGVVVGVYEDSKEVSDEDITKALTETRRQIGMTIDELERLARCITRIQHAPGSPALQ
jgi:hypothetical protein